MKRKVIMAWGIGLLCGMMPMTALASTVSEGNIQAVKAVDIVAAVGAEEQVTVGEEVQEVGEDVLTVSEVEYRYVVENGKAKIQRCTYVNDYSNEEVALTVPSTLGGYPVTAINSGAFCEDRRLVSVVIPEGVTYIEHNVFRECINLKKVILPSTLEVMGASVFAECTALEEIEIPKNVCEVGYDIFEGCTSLTRVTFEEGISRIPSRIFCGFDGLESFVVPDTVSSIGMEAFARCSNLKEITIPSSVKFIEELAFKNCTALTKVNGADGVKKIGRMAFEDCEQLTDFTLSPRLRTMGEYAFAGSGLQEVVISDKLIEIPTNAFNGCESLTSVKLGAEVVTIGTNAFANCSALTDIQMNDKLEHIGNEAFKQCYVLTKVSLPNSVAYLGSGIFDSCRNLSDVTLGNGMSCIPSEMFAGCSSLKSIVLPYNICSIEEGAFDGCNRLAEITVPPATNSIYYGAFDSVNHLTVYGRAGTLAEKLVASMNENTKGNTNGYIGVYPDNPEITEQKATFVEQTVDATDIHLSSESITLEQGQNARLIVDIQPMNFNGNVIWKSSNEEVITFGFAGEIYARGTGTATVTVTIGSDKELLQSVDDEQTTELISASCQITVKKTFADVDWGWRYEPTMYVYEHGLMEGTGDMEQGMLLFDPGRSIPREQFAQVLYSAGGKEPVTYSAIFNDVPSGQWYTDAVLWAAENGIVSGYGNGEFGVGDRITREQLATMLYKYAEYRGFDTRARTTLSNFTDEAQVSSWAKEQLRWAVAYGIMSGKGNGTLDPKGTATRAECAAMIRTFMETFEED